MFFRSSTDRMLEVFLRQFEGEGDQILYRKHGRGAPIPVSAEERDRFVSDYRKASRRMIWGAVLLVLIAITLGMFIAPEQMDEGIGTIVISMLAVCSIAIMSLRNSTAPSRELERRTAVGEELTKPEIYARHFATTSWILLGGIFLIAITILVASLTRSTFEHWLDYVWLIGSAAFSILGARALWLKYRYAR